MMDNTWATRPPPNVVTDGLQLIRKINGHALRVSFLYCCYWRAVPALSFHALGQPHLDGPSKLYIKSYNICWSYFLYKTKNNSVIYILDLTGLMIIIMEQCTLVVRLA